MSATTEFSSGKLESATDVTAFERRQEILLERLSQLQGNVNKFRDSLGMTNTVMRSSGPISLVIHAAPSHPPYALLCVLKQVMAEKPGSVQTGWHGHSSLKGPLPNNLMDFLPESDVADQSKLLLKITLIWKEVCMEPETVVGLGHLIRGEVNILRYLARASPSLLDYDESDPKTDMLLDLCHAQLLWGNAQDRQSVLATLDSVLRVRKCLSGGRLGMVDFVAWSALTHCGLGDVRLSHVKKWAESVSQLAEFRAPRSGKGRNKSGGDRRRLRRQSSSGKNKPKERRNSHRNRQKSNSKSPPLE